MALVMGFIFKKLNKQQIVSSISELPNIKIIKDDIEYKNKFGIWFGNLQVKYKDLDYNICVCIRKNTDSYVKLLHDVEGLNSIKGNIYDYGKPQSLVQLDIEGKEDSLEIIAQILKLLGGLVLFKNGGTLSLAYIRGSIDNDNIYNDLRHVPNITLKRFIKSYLASGDISTINKRLKTKIKGTELFKEFTIRNIDIEI